MFHEMCMWEPYYKKLTFEDRDLVILYKQADTPENKSLSICCDSCTVTCYLCCNSSTVTFVFTCVVIPVNIFVEKPKFMF